MLTKPDLMISSFSGEKTLLRPRPRPWMLCRSIRRCRTMSARGHSPEDASVNPQARRKYSSNFSPPKGALNDLVRLPVVTPSGVGRPHPPACNRDTGEEWSPSHFPGSVPHDFVVADHLVCPGRLFCFDIQGLAPSILALGPAGDVQFTNNMACVFDTNFLLAASRCHIRQTQGTGYGLFLATIALLWLDLILDTAENSHYG